MQILVLRVELVHTGTDLVIIENVHVFRRQQIKR